ncbi:RNA polymerase sigma-70 factor (ECF subfamily) [Sinobacterium caligoides]|uniref:RNA polymerase sigma-70 factor (ECF subfamily) n=1 Tax=Sinobacterium caligoides TaxID=933926 RepID=A0A3N2DNT4_9GAMM|nr:RNA polymerase sigma factor [Sinobacterium caligoides]ROS01474.1 RNA polymerase sigma-70 factor (ECF subfamily) [Sinobacterium caligoides]
MTKANMKWLEHLIQQHGTALERFLTRKLNNAEDAAEVAQETFLKLHNLEHANELDDAKAFMYRMAGNMAIDQIRRRDVHDKYISSEMHDESKYHDTSPEQLISAQQQLQRVEQAMNGMSVKARQAFLLHRKSGLSYAQIAEEMNTSVSSVEKLIIQALKHCRQAAI